MRPESRALEVSGLSVDLGGRRVLSDVCLTVDRGELMSLIGPNGAGKTTLLRTALGLIPAARGTVLVDGEAPSSRHRRVGYVPQRHDFAWDFPLNVAGVVMTGLTGALGLLRRPRQVHWEAVGDALERVQLRDLAQRPVGQLSGGQRQRVLVARALALRPTVLLLDEPFTGLDLPTQELLSGLFRELALEGRAVLMTTHDLFSALSTSDRLTLLNRTVVASGSASELTGEPDLWTQTFGVGADSPLVRMVQAVSA